MFNLREVIWIVTKLAVMDDDGLRNWGYYEPFKEHLGLQLMSPLGDHRDTKPFFSSRENPLLLNPNGATYHHPHTRMVSEPTGHMNYMRDGWIQRERFHHMQPGNPSYSALSNTTSSHNMHLVPALDMSKDHVTNMLEEDNAVGDDSGGGSGNGGEGGSSIKKRGSASAPKTPRTKRPKKGSLTPKVNGKTPGHRAKTVKKNVDMVINGIDMDISGIPIPICSCTGSPQQCYRWGAGGWQSACCTTTISMYPLPMSTKRRGARIAGRKMSQGAFKKVLEKLASEGYDFSNAIDLRTYWAKHGTNKFVTIR